MFTENSEGRSTRASSSDSPTTEEFCFLLPQNHNNRENKNQLSDESEQNLPTNLDGGVNATLRLDDSKCTLVSTQLVYQ